MNTENENERKEKTEVPDGTYLTKDEKIIVVQDRKPVRAYDVHGMGWLFRLF